jgi:hypothetical protein
MDRSSLLACYHLEHLQTNYGGDLQMKPILYNTQM